MACPKKAKQLTILDYQSKKLKMAEAEDHDSESEMSESHLELEDESLDEQDFSETERDSFLPTSSMWQDNQITVQYPSAPTTIIINDFFDHRNVAQDQLQNIRVSPE